ncbi:MAG: gliding motility-associated C-terminal domain-containing protein [Saprospiraceae bacterium]|nr:gliding motility-associated C-terminal domain-containing protein [Saprospiraceae bacterium]
MNIVKQIYLFSTLFCFTAVISAQEPCNYTAGYTCATAPIICNLSCLDGFVGTTPQASAVVNTLPQQPQYLCTSGGQPQNMSWFAFIAGSNYAKITITPFNCELNNGIQAGIFDDCDFSDIVINNNPYAPEYIDCEFPFGDMSTIVLESSSLIPGQIYYFYVDGYDSDVCSYRVDIISATQHYELHNMGKFTQSNDTLEVCPNTTQPLSVDSLDLDIYYYWKLDPPTANYPYADFTKLDSVVNWTFPDTGIYTISMYATNGCDITDTISKTLVVAQHHDEDFGDDILCENLFPYSGPQDLDPNSDGVLGWQGPGINVPGIHTHQVNLANGCVYNQTINVITQPLQPREKVTLIDCQPFIYHDLTLDNSFRDFPHNLPVMDRNGCDSLVMIDAYIPGLQASIIQEPCKDGKVKVSCHPVVSSCPPGYTLNYSWKDQFGNRLTDEDSNPVDITVLANGNISLSLQLEINGKSCPFDVNPLSVDINAQLPQSPIASGWDLELCMDDARKTYAVVPASGIIGYEWTVNNGAEIIGNQTGTSVEVDFANATGAPMLCVTAINDCGKSQPLCLPVTLLERPVLNMLTDVIICEDSVLMLELNVPRVSTYTYSWSISGATLKSGDTESYGPLSVSYNLPGTYRVSVTAANKECVSPAFGQNVEVIPTVGIPVVSGTSFAEKIELSWASVPCAKAYSVYIDNKLHIVTATTNTVLEGLSRDQTVNVKIETQGEDCACGISAVIQTFKTLSCQEVNIDLTASKSVICEVDWNNPVILAAALNGSQNSGVFSWEGKGVNPVTGFFLPAEVGSGSHFVYYNYSEMGCFYRDSINLVLVKTPAAAVMPVDPECANQTTGTVQVIPELNATGFSYFLDGSRMDGPIMENVSIGSHMIEIIDGNQCRLVKSVTINPPTYPNVNIEMDEGPFYDNEAFSIAIKDINSELNLIDSVEWYINGILFCSGSCLAADFSSLEGGTYAHQLIIYYKNCFLEEEFELLIKESPKVFLSNIFSLRPASGSNQVWKAVSNDPDLIITSMEVFSRWGEKLLSKQDFKLADQESLWDGTFQGNEVIPGVYVAVIKYMNEKGEPVTITSDITVIR